MSGTRTHDLLCASRVLYHWAIHADIVLYWTVLYSKVNVFYWYTVLHWCIVLNVFFIQYRLVYIQVLNSSGHVFHCVLQTTHTVDSRYYKLGYYDMSAYYDGCWMSLWSTLCSIYLRLYRNSGYIDIFSMSHAYRNNWSLLYVEPFVYNEFDTQWLSNFTKNKAVHSAQTLWYKK